VRKQWRTNQKVLPNFESKADKSVSYLQNLKRQLPEFEIEVNNIEMPLNQQLN